MRETALVGTLYGDADGYDGYMGHWSAALAPKFLSFALRGKQPGSLLDLGAGTGNLLAAAAATLKGTKLTAIDPSPVLLARARLRPGLSAVDFREGMAESLPFPPDIFDACLSLLVLQEFAEPRVAICEMKRVTRAGGIVAACLWDFAKMPVIAMLVDALATAAPETRELLASRSRPFQSLEELAAAWTLEGFSDVSAHRIAVTREFRSFDDLWRPLLTGSTPSTLALSALPADRQSAVRAAMQWRLAGSPGIFGVTAEALAVRATVRADLPKWPRRAMLRSSRYSMTA